MSGGKLHFLEQKVQSLAFIYLFHFFSFGSGSASGMMLLKVSILCFKPFKSMSSMESQLPPRGTELFACSVSSLRVLWFMEQQLSGLLGGFGEIQAGLRADTFRPKSREQGLGVAGISSGTDSDFWHSKSPFVVETCFKRKGKMKLFVVLFQIMSYWITFMVQPPPPPIFKTIIYISKSHLFKFVFQKCMLENPDFRVSFVLFASTFFWRGQAKLKLKIPFT